MNIKKGDSVYVINGEQKGKIAKVLHVFPAQNRLIVEGVNMIKRHTRPTQRNRKGGIVTKEASIHRSNVKVYCSTCSSPTRISQRVVEAKGSRKGTAKVRVCRLCGAEL
jgi:large subunit ribosomal protein L24